MADSEPAVYSAPVSSGLLASAAQVVRPNTKLIALLSIGHFVVDLNQGSLPALLPFLKSAHQLSYAAVATIVLAGNVASSIVQPLFGYFADQTARRWMLPASVLLTGVGFALLGMAPGYAALLALVVAMGLGVAAYHPEAYKTATSVAGERKATALSWFSLGGNVGIALGPPVITALVTVVGLTGSLGLLVPTLIASLLLLTVLPAFSQSAAPRAAAAGRGPRRQHAARHGAADPGRHDSLVDDARLHDVRAVLLHRHARSRSATRRAAALRLPGRGRGRDRHRGAVRRPLGPARLHAMGAARRAAVRRALLAATRGVLAFVMLGIFGALLTSSFTVSVVLGQAYLPRNAGMASGLIVGFAIGAGGLGVTALGWVADRYGLPAALWISALTPLLAVAATRLLPAPRVQKPGERRPSVPGRRAGPAHRSAWQATPDLSAQVGDLSLRPRVGAARRDHRPARGQLGAQLDGAALSRAAPDARRVRPGDAARRPGHLSQGPGDDPVLGRRLPGLPRARGRHRLGCPDAWRSCAPSAPKAASSPTSSATSSRAGRWPTSTCGSARSRT